MILCALSALVLREDYYTLAAGEPFISITVCTIRYALHIIRNNKYNKLVLAQHLDDLAESFMMSALHNGQIRTMKANYNIEAGDVRVIRPLIYVREKATREFSITAQLPIINENCPACFEQPKVR